MRKVIFALLMLCAVSSQAQNLQVMYDFGNGRQNVTSTLEMFKPDKWGNTFFFVDMEFNGANHQPSSAYMEIARCLKFWDGPISAHVEYNGGLIHAPSNIPMLSTAINNAYLIGADYAWHDKAFSKFLNLKVLYKNIQGVDNASFQITGVWNLNYLNNKLTVSGFADFWKETHTCSNDNFVANFQTKHYIFLTEPQIWYNFTPKFAAGSEVEMSTNFGGHVGFMINPTIAMKYTF